MTARKARKTTGSAPASHTTAAERSAREPSSDTVTAVAPRVAARSPTGWAALPWSLLDLCFEALDLRELLVTGEAVCATWRRASQTGSSGWRRMRGGFSLQAGWKATTACPSVLRWLVPRIVARLSGKPSAQRGRLHYDMGHSLYGAPLRDVAFLAAFAALLQLPWPSGVAFQDSEQPSYVLEATEPATLGGSVDLRAEATAEQWRLWLGALGPVRALTLGGQHLTAQALRGLTQPRLPPSRPCAEATTLAATHADAKVVPPFPRAASTLELPAVGPAFELPSDCSALELPTVCSTLEHLRVWLRLGGDLRFLTDLSALRSLSVDIWGDTRLPALTNLSALSIEISGSPANTPLVIDGDCGDLAPPYPALCALSMHVKCLSTAEEAVGLRLPRLLNARQLRTLTHLDLSLGYELVLPALPRLEVLSLHSTCAVPLRIGVEGSGAPYPALRRLELRSWALASNLFRGHAPAFCALVASPALRSLKLEYGFARSPHILARLLKRRGLESVALTAVYVPEVAAALTEAAALAEPEAAALDDAPATEMCSVVRPAGVAPDSATCLSMPSPDARRLAEAALSVTEKLCLQCYHYDLRLAVTVRAFTGLQALSIEADGNGCSVDLDKVTEAAPALHILALSPNARLSSTPSCATRALRVYRNVDADIHALPVSQWGPPRLVAAYPRSSGVQAGPT